MTTQPSGYQRSTEEQRVKIKEMWDMYKKDIGLEGYIYLRLARDGKSLAEINGAIEEHRKNIEGNLETWHNLRKEA